MTAVAVNVFVIEAMRYSVFGSARRFFFRSAKPMPFDQTSLSSWTMPTAAPGSRCSFTNDAAFASYSAPLSAAGLGTSAKLPSSARASRGGSFATSPR